jgi:hypothetical protein
VRLAVRIALRLATSDFEILDADASLVPDLVRIPP